MLVTRSPGHLATIVAVCGLGAVFASGCSDSGDSSGPSNAVISSQTLSGRIGGQSWTLGTAESDSFLSTSDEYFVDMYSETFPACQTGAATSDSNHFIADLPTAVGSYNLGMSQTVTFYVAATSENLVAIDGRIQIDSISGTTISGGLKVTFNADNVLDGQFQASICP